MAGTRFLFVEDFKLGLRSEAQGRRKYLSLRKHVKILLRGPMVVFIARELS